MRVIRWLGAFRHAQRGQGGLHAALQFELSSPTREVAAEVIPTGWGSSIIRPRVGLLVAPTTVLRRFDSDVWSEIDCTNGRLRPTRGVGCANTEHREAFCLPVFEAIVVRNFGGLCSKTQKILTHWSNESGLPIVEENKLLWKK